jgi:hypothetical protein
MILITQKLDSTIFNLLQNREWGNTYQKEDNVIYMGFSRGLEINLKTTHFWVFRKKTGSGPNLLFFKTNYV